VIHIFEKIFSFISAATVNLGSMQFSTKIC